MSGLPASMKPISAMDVCRLANTGKVNSLQNLRDAPNARQQNIAPSSSMMYEDTDFIVPTSHSAASSLHGSNTAMPTGMGQPLPAFQNQARPLIYEDTDVFMMPALPAKQPYSSSGHAPSTRAGPQIPEQHHQQSFSHASCNFQQHPQSSMPPYLQGSSSSTVDENAGFVKQLPAYTPSAQSHHSQAPSNMHFGPSIGTSRGMGDQMPWGIPAASQMGIYEDTELLLQDRG